MNKYPKVNYIGNKEKIASWIIENLPLQEGTVLDLFSGGCSVAYALKKSGFRVFTNDVLYSNYCISKAIIENAYTQLNINLNDENIKTFFSKETYENIKFLENKIYFPEEVIELTCLINYSKTLKKSEKYIFLSLLRRAMIRKIPYSRMNIKWEEIIKFRDEDFSYLKYKRRRAYHNKTFLFHIYDNLVDYNAAVFDNNKDNKSYQKDAIDMVKGLKEKVDIIYIDPPYPSTMNKYEEFYGAYDLMFQKNIKYTDFTNKTYFINNLLEIIKASKDKTKYIILSLNNKSNPSYKEIENTMRDFVKNIYLEKKNHTYKVTGKENKQNNYEVLVIMEI